MRAAARGTIAPALAWLLLAAAGAGCAGPEPPSAGAGGRAGDISADPQVLQGLDAIPGWTRTGPPELYKKDGLYGYIDGGAEIVLQYGFRELSVTRFRPDGEATAGSAPDREITLEIYRMDSGEDAFGLYSTKLEGGEKAWPVIAPDNWVGGGQAGLVKDEYVINVLAPGCDDRKTGEFLARIERQVPGQGTIRPAGLARLPGEGMIASSWHFIKGPLAAQNESPFLDAGFWGFAADPDKADATKAFSAKYGAPPAVSKLVVVALGKGADAAAVDSGVLALFKDYLRDVVCEDGIVQGRNEAGRWFLYGRSGGQAALVLGEPDRVAGRSRLHEALARPA
jgi:hypothetical protein